MKTIFKDEEGEDYFINKIGNGIFGDITNLRFLDFPFESVEELKKYRTIFGRAITNKLQYAFEQRTYENNNAYIPYLNFNSEENFNSIYSSNRNKYIAAYLDYLYNLEHPKSPLADYIAFKLKDGNIEQIGYDYKKYMPITEAEGDTISKAALRYLTWGVEYTPFSGVNNVQPGNSSSRVYSFPLDINGATINDLWLNLSNPTNRQFNYYPNNGYSIDSRINFELPPSDPDRIQVFT